MATIKAEINISKVGSKETIDIAVDYGDGVTHKEYGKIVSFLMNDMALNCKLGYEITICALGYDAVRWGLNSKRITESPDE